MIKVIGRPTKRSFSKLLLVSALFSIVPFGIACGVFAYFGFHTVQFLGESRYGLEGLLSGVFFSFIVTIFLFFYGLTFGAFGLWLYCRYSKIEIEILGELNEDEENT